MERPFELGTVRVVSASEVEVTMYFPSNKTGKSKQVFKLEQVVNSGMSPKDFVAQLSRDLADRIGAILGWSEKEVSLRQVTIQLQKELEGALFSNVDFRSKFEGQFTQTVAIKDFSIKQNGLYIVYEEISPVVLYRMANPKEENASRAASMTNTVSYSLRGFKDSETFLHEFAKDIGKQVDDIWISDRLRLKNAVLKHLYNRRRKPKTLLKYAALFLAASFLVFSVLNYIPTIDYREPKPELAMLKEKVFCFRTALESQEESSSMRSSVFDELDNIELFLQGLGETTSEENIQFISTEINEFQEKLSLEGILLNEC